MAYSRPQNLAILLDRSEWRPSSAIKFEQLATYNLTRFGTSVGRPTFKVQRYY